MSTSHGNCGRYKAAVFERDPRRYFSLGSEGTIDVSITPGEGISPQELLPILRGIIKTLGLPDKKKAALIKAVDKLEKSLAKEFKDEHKKKVRLEKAFEGLIRKIRKLEKKGILAQTEANELVGMIERVKVGVVE